MTNRFKGLYLVGRVPAKIWIEVHNIIQEVVTKALPKKQKCKKAKWLSEEVLQIAEERREVKGKGERERFAQLNAEFQRTARRDKKAILGEQGKKIRKTTEWERLEIASRKLEILKEHPYGKKWRRTKEPLDESKRGEWKNWLKAQHSEK